MLIKIVLFIDHVISMLTCVEVLRLINGKYVFLKCMFNSVCYLFHYNYLLQGFFFLTKTLSCLPTCYHVFAVFEKKLLERGVNLPDTSALARSECKIQILPG